MKKTHKDSWASTVKKDFRVNKSLYAMVLPVIAFYFIFHYMPMYGAIIAFKNFKPQLGIMGSNWVGFKHFADFFTSPSFLGVLSNTFRISLSTIVFGFPAPIILALLLNELRSLKFARVVQNFIYMPHFISLIVVCGLIRNFTADTGLVTYILTFFGFEAKTLLNDPAYFIPIYVASDIWQSVGWGSIIYLAALTNVDSCLYEAAMIDGAGKWKQLLNITIPSIIPTIMIMLILRIGGILNVGYEKIILLYNDLTLNTADVISTYVYRKGLLELNWSFSTAVGLFNSVINFVFLISMNYISRKTNDVGLM